MEKLDAFECQRLVPTDIEGLGVAIVCFGMYKPLSLKKILKIISL